MPTHIQPCTLCIRVFEQGKSYKNKDPYIAVMTGLIISADEILIQGAHGELSRSDIKSIYSDLDSMGFTNVIFERHGKITKSKKSNK